MDPSNCGIIYDLDGTVLDTNQLNEDAWVHALKPYCITPTREQFLFQRGRPGEVCSRHMLPDHLQQYANEVLRQQLRYVEERYDLVTVFPGFWEAYTPLHEKEKKIFICTSAPRERISLLLQHQPPFRQLQDHFVCRGMYAHGKPSPEPLLVTSERMGLKPSQLIYVGDAESDYRAAVAAGMNFIYFCPAKEQQDPAISLSVSTINQHEDILSLLGENSLQK